MKAKTDMTAELVRKTIEANQPKSLSQLAHLLGYKGSVSSTLTKKFRLLIPNIADLLNGGDHQATSPKSPKPVKTGKAKVAKVTQKAVTKPVGAKAGKYAHNEKSPFRAGSSYDKCYSILAEHPAGLPKERLIQLLAAETGKDAKHASYDAQVVLSARPNEDGLNNNDSPRNRSCRPGFWIKRENGHVRLMVD